MKKRVCQVVCVGMACVPFFAWAGDGFFKALSNNVGWADGAQWTNGVPASGENAKATLLPGVTGTANLSEQDSPWLLGKLFVNYGVTATLKGGEFLLRGSPVEFNSGSGAPLYLRSRLAVESNLLVSGGVLLVMNTNRIAAAVAVRSNGGLFFEFPGGESVLTNLQGVGNVGFRSQTVVTNSVGGLTVTNPASFSGGTWYVGNGTLRTVKTAPAALTDPAVTPERVASPILHLDASRTDSFTFTNGIQVLEWRDLSGNGYHARAVVTNTPPLFLANELGSLPAVDFGPYGSAQHMKWAITLTTVRSVFWVVGSQEGGGFLLGGTSAAHFHRGGSLGVNADDPLWGYDSALTTSYLNGVSVNGRTVGLSGGYDLVSLVSASGLTADGLAFDRGNAGRRGGQRLAELLIYDRALSGSERRQVERYLYEKWLASRADLRHVQALSEAVLRTETCDGSTTTVRRLHGRGKLTKTGTGALRIEEIQSYPGTLSLAEGTVVLSNAASGASSAQIAATPVFRLDASAWATTMSLTNDRVYAWRDADSRAVSADLTNAAAKPPVLMRNALNGMPVVDFGYLGSQQFLDWSQRLTQIGTVIWVLGGHGGGGFLLSDNALYTSNPDFHRGSRPSLTGTDYTIEAGLFNTKYPMITWVDGRLCNSQRTSLSGGYQIVSTCRSGGYLAASRIGQDRGFTERSGGLRLAELLIYDRFLTEKERVDTEAYLRAKWFGDAPAVQTLEACGAATLCAEGDLVVDTLTGTGTVTKAGSGNVTLNGLAAFTGTLQTDGGAFRLASRGTAPSGPLAGYAAWFDASRADLMTVVADAGVSRVTRWGSAGNPAFGATNVVSKAPSLLPFALNGLPVVDFEAMYSGRSLRWEFPTNNIRTLFLVYGSQNGGGYLLGASTDTTLFARGITSALNPLSSQNNVLSKGFAWIDGVPVVPTLRGMNGDYQLITLLSGGDATVDAFSYRSATESGGQRYAEVIVYDKPLADEDRKAVEAYLAAKWFNRAIHGYTVQGVPTVPSLDIAGGTALYLDAGATNSVGWMTGEGRLEKTGAGTLELAGSTVGFNGTLDVREGALRYTAGMMGLALPVTNSLVVNLDASLTNSVVLNESGKATNWWDASGNGMCAYAPGVAPDYYADSELGGRRTLDFGLFGSGGGYMFFSRHLPDVRSVFWVLGSQNGGGFLLGCTNIVVDQQISDWHRGSVPNGTSLFPITAANRLYGYNAPGHVIGGKTYIDGVLLPSPTAADATNVLNGGYQLVETHTTADARADGLAFDRVTTIGDRRGGQRLAEILIYNRPLTDEERLEVDAHLKWKWFGIQPRTDLLVMPPDGASADTVRVAAGATFELGGFTQNTRELAGGGTISGGTVSVSGVVNLSDPASGTLTVNGDLVIEDGATVLVGDGNTVDVNGTLTVGGHGLIAWPEGVTPVVGRTAVFTYDMIEGAGNLSLWTGTENYASRFHMRAYADAGTVYVLVKPQGTLMLLN